MPDIFLVLHRRWKFILLFAICATLLAFILLLFQKKLFLSTATALPANSLSADKAHIFNDKIETLYSDFGTADELDRIEGTARLDTVFIATVHQLGLAPHYGFNASSDNEWYAAMQLKKNTNINKGGFGELKIKVWDEDAGVAANAANALLQNVQSLLQHLQNENNQAVLYRLQNDYTAKQQQWKQWTDSIKNSNEGDVYITAKKNARVDQLLQYEKLISQYQLAINTNAPVLLMAEKARPSLWPDKPKKTETLLFVFIASLLFAFLLAVFLQSKQ